MSIFVKMQNHLKMNYMMSFQERAKLALEQLSNQSITCYLNNGTQSSSKAESSKQIREQETKRLKNFIS